MEDRRVEPGAVRVLLVDDHAMFTKMLGLQLAAYHDIDFAGCANTVATAVVQARELDVDVIVLDYRLPDGDGVALAATLTSSNPRTKLVMLTGYHDDHVLRAAVAAGCVALVTKDSDVDELVRAVRAAARGETLFSPSALRLISAASSAPDILTEREVQMVRLLAEGHSTREIAHRLFISVNTVRNHAQSVLRKLDAHSRLEAVAAARRLGIIDDGELT
jgi:DNA-binding NarL/FixJ family response regulator